MSPSEFMILEPAEIKALIEENCREGIDLVSIMKKIVRRSVKGNTGMRRIYKGLTIWPFRDEVIEPFRDEVIDCTYRNQRRWIVVKNSKVTNVDFGTLMEDEKGKLEYVWINHAFES